MLAARAQRPALLGAEARELLALLEEDSPQSTKQLRRNASLSGRASERSWTRAMRELWEALLIVGTGEVDDGAFPSLEVGATRWVFEELWEEAQRGLASEQEQLIERVFGGKKGFGVQWRKG